MKKYFTGLMMSWGNFCTVPCPKKLWDSNCQSLMLAFLPTVGLVIGLLWATIYFGLVYFAFPFLAVSFIVTFLPYALSGFIHLDGFMDCSDAILSRRPLEDRQRILKDSHTGAFAVISVVFLILGSFTFMSTSISLGIDFVNLVMIAIVSRSIAALEVLSSKPMKTSQYVIMNSEQGLENMENMENIKNVAKTTAADANDANDVIDVIAAGAEICAAYDTAGADKAVKTVDTADGGGNTSDNAVATIAADDVAVQQTSIPVSKKTGAIVLIIQLAIYIVLGFVFSSFGAATALVCGATIIATMVAIAYGKKQLGGMNGDIAGYGIVWGELIGVFALMLC